MNEARYASLSSGLLARKGSAKPAMRPQGFTSIEDLGWNDMGYAPGEDTFEVEAQEHVPSSIAALTPAPRPTRSESEILPVVAQQRAIAESFAAEESDDVEQPVADPGITQISAPKKIEAKAKIVSLPKRPAVATGKKTAFTLRLDPERHFRLRLACAVTGRSAQQIVTTALDEFLEALPELETMAQRIPGLARN